MRCTYCGSTDFYEGPSGGLSTNIRCANEDCRHWFNFNGISGIEDLHRVNPTKEEKEKKASARRREVEERPHKAYQEGITAYQEGSSARSLIASYAEWHQTNGADFFRLAGYLDAMRKRGL